MHPHPFIGGMLAPHPPIIVPTVGKGREHDAHATCKAMDELTALVADWKPETVVLISPHAPLFRDYVFFYQPAAGESVLKGSLAPFGDPVEHAWEWDGAYQERLLHTLSRHDIPAGSLEPEALRAYRLDGRLDHGALVPLHFLTQSGVPFRLVVLASAGIDPQQMYRMGSLIRDEAEALGRRLLLVASGDLSHKVNAESPYGMVPEGERFDRQLVDLLRAGDLKEVAAIDHNLREKAAECGFRSILTLCGALDGTTPEIHVHGYEAPFGIGYGVVSFRLPAATQRMDRESVAPPPSHQAEKEATDTPHHTEREATDTPHHTKREATDTPHHTERETAKPVQPHDAEMSPPATASPRHSDPVRIATETIELFIRKGKHLSVEAAHAPADLLETRAGAFVSLHKFGDLRGCIGTIAPTTHSLAAEIIQNAISAATADPRFPPVSVDELPYLTIHVDVLNPPEPVADKASLDPKRYGVIVEKGGHRGLLLPDLEGVDTVDQQLDIACRKGGIHPEGEYRMSRFTVTRYET